MNDWRVKFESKCCLKNISEDIKTFFIQYTIEKMIIDESTKAILRQYVDINEEITYEEYKKIRDCVISDFLKIPRRTMEADKVKDKTRNQLLKLFLLNILQNQGSQNFDTHCFYKENWMLEILKNIIDIKIVEDVYFKVKMKFYGSDKFKKEGRFISYINEENQRTKNVDINYHNIFYVDCNDYVVFDPNNDENYYSVKVKDTRTSQNSYHTIVETNIEEGSNDNISWDIIENDLYIKTNIEYFNPNNSWEEYLIESYKLYIQKNYKLAFLQSIISLESFIENCIYSLVNLTNLKLSKYMSNNTFNENSIILSYLVSDEVNYDAISNAEIRSVLYYYKRITNNSRNLINEKFVDLVNFNYLLKTQCTINKNLFSEEQNKYLILLKDILNELIKIRNSLAHGENIENIGFREKYHYVISIIIFLILEFKGENNTEFLNSISK